MGRPEARARRGPGGENWPWLPQPGVPGLPGVPGVPGLPGGASFGSGSDALGDLLARRLLEQRVVLLSGALDETTSTRVSAELMTLDAEGDDPVTLRVDCGEAGLAAALTLMDVIELMGVPVRALCLGQVAGGAVGVVAVCSHRAALPSTRFSLCEPATQFEAHVRNVAQWVEVRADERRRFAQRIAAASGKAIETVEADLERGRFLTAEEAVGYGLLDEVSRPDADIRRFPGRGGRPGPGAGSGSGPGSSSGPEQPPMGFRPLR